ncbi:MAG: acyl-CoA dehydrogenase family protein [Gammaproteobacteria bacterium]
MIDFEPDDTPALKAWRAEVRAFLKEALPDGMRWDYDYDEDPENWKKGIDFWRKVGQKGWVALTWPKDCYGQERSAIEKWILAEEFTAYDAPAYPVIGLFVADCILRLGTPEQRRRHLKGIAEATTLWGEGYTEPGAGSDLATLKTRADWDGSHWVINGQKTFGTAGHFCQWMAVLARTDQQAPKHAGISCFLVPLDTPGISMAPLHNIAGGRQNHTFFDNVRVPADSVLGDVNQAWNQVWFRMGGEKRDRAGPVYHDHPYRVVNMVGRLVRYCRETERDGRPISEDPAIRPQLAELLLGAETLKMIWREHYGRFASKSVSPFGEAAAALDQIVYKEWWPHLAQKAMEIVGPLAQIQGGKWARLQGQIQYFYRTGFGNHAGGTSQLKRMILATRGLGLPR